MNEEEPEAAREEEEDFERSPVAVCVYKDLDAYYDEAKAYAEIGYFPVAVTNQPQPRGLMRVLLCGIIFAFVWPPPPILIVTYVKRLGEANDRGRGVAGGRR